MSNGDRWRFYSNGLASVAPFTTYGSNADVYARAVDANNVRFYTTFAAATASYANDAAAKAASITLDSNVADTYYGANFTRVADFGARIATYLDGPAGLAMYQRAYAAFIGKGKLQAWCQLYDVTGYAAGTFASAWGLKSSIYAPDTPRSTWFLSR